MIVAWAGMRGVVTLAAAFLIPEDTPHRDVLLLIAFTVTAGTLFLQGFSLPWLARRLRVPAPDPAADALARAELLNQASQAGLAALEALDEADPHNVSGQIRRRLEYREFVAWEQLGSGTDETPTETYARRRRLMIDAERGRVLTARNTGTGRTRWSCRCRPYWTLRSQLWTTARVNVTDCAASTTRCSRWKAAATTCGSGLATSPRRRPASARPAPPSASPGCICGPA